MFTWPISAGVGQSITTVYTLYSLYRTTTSDYASFVMKREDAASNSLYFDDASYKRVLDPPVTGIHIVSTSGGSTRAWTSIDSGFNANAISTWIIYGSGGSTNWRGSVTSTDIGNLIFNNESSVGVKKASLGLLTTQGDFYYDSSAHYLYLYSTSDPGTYYTSIEAAKYVSGISIVDKNYITIRNLDIRYQGYIGVSILAVSSSCNYITVEYCDLSWIGGCYQPGFGTTRSGNGIQFYDSSAHIVVRYNNLNQIYDAAMTTQSHDAGMTYTDHQYYYNIARNSEYGFEYFVSGAGSSASAINVYNNIFYNNGGGWSHAQRPDPKGTGFLIQSSDGSTTNSNFKNNIIHTATDQLIYIYSLLNDLGGWTLNNNDYYPDGAAAFSLANVAKTFAQWKTATSQDGNTITSNPLFVNAAAYDFRLLLNSPCRGKGTNVSLTLDYAGNTVPAWTGKAPDIGCYEMRPTGTIWFPHLPKLFN
jgi:hypothetical protein